MKLKIESERAFWLFAAVVFALLAAAIYFPVFTGKVPFPRDMVLQFAVYGPAPHPTPAQHYADIGDLVTFLYPSRAVFSRSVDAGTLPLWNPYFLGGSPFLANSQSSLFYPLNLVYYVFSLPAAWTLAFLLRMVLAALFMALFVRSLGASRAGAIFSGIIFATCGFMTAWQGFPMVDAAIWLPFICYALNRLHADRSNLWLGLAAIGFAMPVLAGHPETAAHLTVTGTAWALMLWAFSLKPLARDFNVGFLLKFGLAGVLALGLASIQMLPTLEWLRQVSPSFGHGWPPLPLHYTLGLVSRDILRGSNSAGIWIPTGAAYLGMIAILAASLAPLHRTKKHVLSLAAITFAGFAVAYGVEPMWSLISSIPILQAVKNERMVLVGSFGVAALGGLGITALQETIPLSMRRRLIALSLLGAAFLLTFLLVYDLQLRTAFKAEFMRRPSFSRSLLLISLVPLVWRLYGGLRGLRFPVAVCALVAFDLATLNYGYAGFASRHEIFPAVPAFDFLSAHADPARFRIVELGLPYPSNAHIMYGLASADGYEARVTARQQVFFTDLRDMEYDGITLFTSNILKSNDRRIDMLNVKYFVLTASDPLFKQFVETGRYPMVFHDPFIGIFENKTVLPRALAVPASGAEVYDDINEQLGRLRSPAFDPERSVVLSGDTASLIGFESSRRASSSPSGAGVEMTESSVNELAFRTVTTDDSVLVVSQTYYPGWKATVDGKESAVFPVNIALTGILLPGGAHEVRLAFEPASFKRGSALTLLSLVVVVSLIAASLFEMGRNHLFVPLCLCG